MTQYERRSGWFLRNTIYLLISRASSKAFRIGLYRRKCYTSVRLRSILGGTNEVLQRSFVSRARRLVVWRGRYGTLGGECPPAQNGPARGHDVMRAILNLDRESQCQPGRLVCYVWPRQDRSLSGKTYLRRMIANVMRLCQTRLAFTEAVLRALPVALSSAHIFVEFNCGSAHGVLCAGPAPA